MKAILESDKNYKKVKNMKREENAYLLKYLEKISPH